jgi:N-dimethylarginine dimethylaminohydrolase
MCAPDHFDVNYSINPWMDLSDIVRPERAREQWQDLVSVIRSAGAKVDVVEQVPGLPDMVFVANGGIVDNETFTPATMRHAERKDEIPHLVAWFEQLGWKVLEPAGSVQEGAGDALPFGGVLVAGHGFRSEQAAYAELAEQSGWRVLRARLTDPRFYHVDIAFCPLTERSALVVPDAFDPDSLRAIVELVPDPVTVTVEEALEFSGNSVVVGDVVIMPTCSPRLEAEIRRRGLQVAVCDVSEFRKAGGGCRCLTLALDSFVTTATTRHTHSLAGRVPNA